VKRAYCSKTRTSRIRFFDFRSTPMSSAVSPLEILKLTGSLFVETGVSTWSLTQP